MVNAFFWYFGSKQKLSRYYFSPKHDTIIEPFAGGAGYSLRYPSRKVILYEINPVVASLWDYLIKVKEKELINLPDETDDRLPQEANFFIILCNYSGKVHIRQNQELINSSNYYDAEKITEKNTNVTKRWVDVKGGWEKHKLKCALNLRYIRHWKIYNKSYEECPNQEACWFIDPPYSNRKEAYYAFNDVNYEALSHFCKTRLGQVQVCEADTADWLPFTQFRRVKTFRGWSNEVVWFKNCGLIDSDTFSFSRIVITTKDRGLMDKVN